MHVRVHVRVHVPRVLVCMCARVHVCSCTCVHATVRGCGKPTLVCAAQRARMLEARGLKLELATAKATRHRKEALVLRAPPLVASRRLSPRAVAQCWALRAGPCQAGSAHGERGRE